MNIIQKHEPLNNTDSIDRLMAELKSIPGSMNEYTFIKILQSIKKAKIQMYFTEHYPKTMFKEKLSAEITAILPESNTHPQPSSTTAQPKQKTPAPKLPFSASSMGSQKHIYGTYIEMAFHNFFLTMRHIYAQTFGLDIMECAAKKYNQEKKKQWNEDFASMDYVWTPMFKDLRNALPEEKLKAEELLDQHFPFLVPLLDYTKNSREYKQFDKLKVLEHLSLFMRVARNFYSHFEITLHENQLNDYNNIEPLVIKSLEHIFLASKRVIKDRFAYDELKMKCAEQYEFIIDKNFRDERGKAMKKKVEIAGFNYRITNREQDGIEHLSRFGTVSFYALFLEKKYAKIFADKLHVVKQVDVPIIGEMMSVYRIRLKVQRLTVTKSSDALALDIINELQRCPKELFDRLSPEDQRSFRVKSEDGEEALMVRHSDRFPQMVMKYIDDHQLFSDIRFQVSLGKYFYKFYNKKCIDADSESRVRALSKDIHGFGRWADIENLRKNIWKDMLREYDEVHRNTTDEKPYITDHKASYVLNGNRIAMRIFDGKEHIFMPDLTDEGARNVSPTCWMSIYELPAMVFLMHLTDSTRVEDIIKHNVTHYSRLFADIRDGKVSPFPDGDTANAFLEEHYGNIQLKDIPKTLQNYLCLDRDAKDISLIAHAKALVEDLIEQTKYKLQKFESDTKAIRDPKQNKIGKRGYTRLLPGRMASFMAKDIMFFQPCNEDKLTGLNFRILQSVLATYDNGDTDVLKRTMTAAHLLGQPNDPRCNPIIMKLWAKQTKPHDTASFYKAYLEARLSYLQLCSSKANWTSLPFVHAGRAKWQEQDEEFCRAKAGRYLHEEYGGTEYDKAIELPRGLFDRPIREELSKMSTMSELAHDASKNTAYLIYAYFMRVMHDDCQTFYNARRNYPLFDILYRKSPRDPHIFNSLEEVRKALAKDKGSKMTKDTKDYLLTVKPSERDTESARIARLSKQMKDNETLLKRYKVQDMLLFLMAKRILLDGYRNGKDEVQFKAVESIHLHDLKDGQALSQKIRMRINVQTKNGCEKSIAKDGIKMKDYARFYQILNDRRLPSLLDLVQGYEVDHDMIEQEFNGYDKVHPKILEHVFNYERYYTEDTGIPVSDKFSEMVFNDNRFDEQQKKAISKIRNSFAHVSYPDYWTIRDIGTAELPRKAEHISDKFQEEIKKAKNKNK